MVRVYFIYNSTRICPSLYFTLFFQLVGLRFHESWLDFDTGDQKDSSYDMELYYAADYWEYKECARKIKFWTNHVLVCPHGIGRADDQLSIVRYRTGDEFSALREVLDRMQSQGVLSKISYEDLCACLDLYETHRIWELYLEGRYFYPAKRNENRYTIMRERFAKAAKAYLNAFMGKGTWGNKTSLHRQFAGLNLMYEGNFYCIRSGGSEVFNTDDMICRCQDICKTVKDKAWKENFNQLQGQICDDILQDYNAALYYYGKCGSGFSVQVHFRKGIIYQRWKEYEKALEHYQESIRQCYQHYQSWYRIGRCSMLAGKYSSALSAFHNVLEILQSRLNADVLQPMEMEYLFKGQNQRAYICNKIMDWQTESVKENQTAVDVWETIDTSSFYQQMKYPKRPKKLWDITRNSLPVQKIYYEIKKLAVRLGDDQLKSEMQEKINKIYGGYHGEENI